MVTGVGGRDLQRVQLRVVSDFIVVFVYVTILIQRTAGMIVSGRVGNWRIVEFGYVILVSMLAFILL